MYCRPRGAHHPRRIRARQGRVGQHPDRRPPPGAPVPLILPPKDGFLLLDRDKLHGSFAADLPAEQAAFMADSKPAATLALLQDWWAAWQQAERDPTHEVVVLAARRGRGRPA